MFIATGKADSPLIRVEGLLPPVDAETPPATSFQTDTAKVVALRGGVVEEFLGNDPRDGVA